MNARLVKWFTTVSANLANVSRQFLEGIQTQRTLLYTEWTIIVFSAVVYGFFSGPMLDFVSPGWGPFPFLLSWLMLSFVFPSNRPYWQKRLYIFIEIALMIIAVSLNLGIETLLYLFIAKACFLLRRRDVMITVALTGIVYHATFLWTVPQSLDYWQSNPQEVFDPTRWIIMRWVESIFIYIVAVTFVLLFSFAIISERKAQKRAANLVKEVKTLGAALERERIARDIHDTLGNTLTTLNIQLEVAQETGAANISQTLQRLETAKYLADQCLLDVRQAVQTMRASDFDLTQALGVLMTQLQQTSSIDTSKSRYIHPQVQLNLPQLPLQASYQLYCIIREGVTNIQKHADATQVKLRGWCTADSLLVELSDNGSGFALTQSPQGFGLQGMQERVQMLGGILQIQTAPEKGTILTVQLPLPPSIMVSALKPEVP